MGEDVPWVSLDPPELMLAPLSMTNAEYHLWRADIPYAEHLTDEMEYDEFSKDHLKPTLIQEVFIFSSPLPFILPFLYFYT